jgi:Arc/MetJ-type ribon-helix-helix transcriptional regulator
MVKTLNVSLTPEQLAWVNAEKVERGFATASDVVRDMIRQRQEAKWQRLQREFAEMGKRDGAPGPEPVHEIMKTVRRVKKERREVRRAA